MAPLRRYHHPRRFGGAQCTNTIHQIAFAPNINSSNAVDLTLPPTDPTVATGQQHLRANVLALLYTDSATGSNVLLASVQDSIGQLGGPNTVVYTNCWDGGFSSDVRYVQRPWGCSQTIVLNEQPPAPADFGLNPQTTLLQVVTEFLAPPTPTLQQETRPGGTVVDREIRFPTMRIIQGRAFMTGGTNTPVPFSARVDKHWVAGSRTLLVEEVKFSDIAAQVAGLPLPQPSGTNGQAGLDRPRRQVLAKFIPPPPRTAKPGVLATIS